MIQVENLVKRYGSHVAVDHLNFTMEDNRIYGFLGPNGAGKSTTMNIMTGYLGPTEGTVKIDGFDILEDPLEAKRRIGYLPELPPVYMDMTVSEYLAFAAELKGVVSGLRREQIDMAAGRCGLTEVMDRMIQNLSKGYRQRVGLAQALLGMPPVLVLDEPMVGLDPRQILEMRDLLKDLSKKHTIILSSHILSEIQAVCDHILIISHGRLVASDTPENLERNMCQGAQLVLETSGKREDLEDALRPFLPSLEGGYRLERREASGGSWHVAMNLKKDAEIREELFYKLAGHRCPILSLQQLTPSLEEVFLELTGGNTGEDQEKQEKQEDREKREDREDQEDQEDWAEHGGERGEQEVREDAGDI